MPVFELPEEIRGEWIWLATSGSRLEEYVFFRREFTLFETPRIAELWITARSLFHVFINGRCMGFGPTPCPGENAEVVYLDASFCLETGSNVIAVLGHNAHIARFAGHSHDSGLWAQLNIDGVPSVWTDESWLCHEGDCYDVHVPRRSLSKPFCERILLEKFPLNWIERDFQAEEWLAPDSRMTLGQAQGKLEPAAHTAWDLAYLDDGLPVARGRCEQVQDLVLLDWSGPVAEHGAGAYMAETFFYLSEDVDTEIGIYTDDPYILFVNSDEVKRQGVKALPPRADLAVHKPLCFGQEGRVLPETDVTFVRGWNRLLIAQQVEPGSAGITITFPDFAPGMIAFLRKPEEKGSGWSVVGPLRTPLALITPQLPLAHLPKQTSNAGRLPARDESALLMAFGFTPDESERVSTPPASLRTGEYIVLDFGRTVYGCPEITLGGQANDVIDVVCAEQFVDGQVLPCNDGHRNADTLVLGPEPNYTWTACSCRGFRYVMVLVRRAQQVVELDSCGVRLRDYRHDNPGAFSCSDDVLNDIWTAGRHTLLGTMQGRFLDSPTKDHTQYITDAMIQSWSAYHTFGAFEMAAAALRDFARIQFETGAMSAVCPSDTFIEMPDYSFMWPVWLHRHYLYTGDKPFLEEMLPVADRLLAYYRHMSGPDTEVLADLDVICGAYCFLDHGDIDRRGMVTGLNALYCRALLSTAWLHEQTGRASRASSLRHRASRVANTVRELTYDTERKLFADSWHDGEPSDFFTWQTNVLAVYGGIALPEQYDDIFQRLFADEPPFEPMVQGDTNNPFFKYFVLESAFALGRRHWAASLMRSYWGSMLKQGAKTWWELYEPDSADKGVPTFSLCHGYGASPNGYLHTEIAGIRPAEPGFTRVYFNPLPDVVEWVKAHIPTPYGHIDVHWKREPGEQLEADITANFPLEVIPVLEPHIARTAVIRVNDDVTVLAEAT